MTFEVIYQTHHKMVLNLALHYVQQLEDAEEITQDVFIKVHSQLKLFRKESSLKTWIYRITINQALDFIKSRQAKKNSIFQRLFSLSDLQPPLYPVNFNHPGVDMEQKEACAKIFSAINKLPDQQKTAIILLKIEQKTQQETAEIMGISVKALESIFYRAKIKLSQLLNR
jgi:RNA polymerase sigma factor (sigma-70 family)